jgi:hypothetical protein
MRAEDVNTEQEDHAYDDSRYAVMSRPWIAPVPAEPATSRLKRKETMADLDRWMDRKARV